MSELKKELKYIDIFLAGVGNILGAGIYLLLGITSSYSKGLTWLSIILSGLFCLLATYGYYHIYSQNIYSQNVQNERPESIVHNNSEFSLIESVFGPNISNLVLGISFLGIIFTISTVSVSFSYYLENLVGIPAWIGGILGILSVVLVNCYGLRATINLNNIATIIEVIGLVIVIIGGFSQLNVETIGITDLTGEIRKVGLSKVFYGAFLFLFAFHGFESLIKLTEEAENPSDIMDGMRDSILVTMVLYVLVAVASISLIGWKNLSLSKIPLADVISQIGGKSLNKLLSFSAVFSTYNTALLLLLLNSRLIYRYAKTNNWETLSYLDPERKIPTYSIIFCGLLSLLVSVGLPNLETLTQYSNCGFLVLLAAVNIAAWLDKKIDYSKLTETSQDHDEKPQNSQHFAMDSNSSATTKKI